jgi:hypothetical protein
MEFYLHFPCIFMAWWFIKHKDSFTVCILWKLYRSGDVGGAKCGRLGWGTQETMQDFGEETCWGNIYLIDRDGDERLAWRWILNRTRGWELVHMAQNGAQWRAVVNTVMNIWATWRIWDLLMSRAVDSFCRLTVLCDHSRAAESRNLCPFCNISFPSRVNLGSCGLWRPLLTYRLDDGASKRLRNVGEL